VAHHPACEPGPATAGDLAVGALAPCPADARQERRHDDQRGGHRQQRREDAADPHRVDELLREEQQRRAGAGDRQPAQQDGAARGGHRHSHGLVLRGPRGPLLAVARDDEEPVVHRQAESERGREVQRVDRHVHHLAEQAQDRGGADHREPADREWQQRGGEAAEHEEQHDREQRKRDQLGLQQVLADDLVVLVEAGVEAAELEFERVRPNVVADTGDRLLRLLLAGLLEVDEHEAGAAVVRQQHLSALAAGERRLHATHGGVAPQLRTNVLDRSAAGRGRERARRADQHDEPRLGVVAEGRVEALRRLGALRAGRVEPGRAELVRDREARDRQRGDQADEGERTSTAGSWSHASATEERSGSGRCRPCP
jgi:hypothetical protein